MKGSGQDFYGDQEWLGPSIGRRSIWQVTPRWNFTTISDIGGFGAGFDLIWQAAGLLGYRFSILTKKDSQLLLGCRALSQDHEDGSGADKFEWDVIAHVPMASLSIRF